MVTTIIQYTLVVWQQNTCFCKTNPDQLSPHKHIKETPPNEKSILLSCL